MLSIFPSTSANIAPSVPVLTLVEDTLENLTSLIATVLISLYLKIEKKIEAIICRSPSHSIHRDNS